MPDMLSTRWPFAIVFATSLAVGADMPRLTVHSNNGRAVTGWLDARTNDHRLWLRFGSEVTSIQRGFDWTAVTKLRSAEREWTKSEVLALSTELAQSPRSVAHPRVISVPGSTLPPIHLGTRRPQPSVAFVTGDAMLGNWDLDSAADGLLVQVTPRDAHGNPVCIQGTLQAELYSFRRIEQDSAALGRGQTIGLLGRWTERFRSPEGNETNWLRLPFSLSASELDSSWAPYGLLQIELIVPGDGVFHVTIDGLRTRAYAPFRDALERQTGSRLISGETAR